MPTTSQYFSDLQLPTIFGDETTYGGILNSFMDGLATKIADLNTRLATATTQLGDNSTSGSLLYGINQLNTLNAQVAANSPALIPSNVLTGTETNIITSPDQFSGDRSTTSSFPAVPNASGTTANVLSALSPPTTEAEVSAFDYLAFYNALAPVVADLTTRVSQVEADIASARVNICKAKKYTDAKQAGGTVTKVLGSVSSYYWTNPDNGSSSGSYLANASYSVAQNSLGNPDYTYNNGLLTVAFSLRGDPHYPYGNTTSTNLQAHNRLVSNGYLTSGSFVDVYAYFVGNFLSSFATNATIRIIGLYSSSDNPFFTNGAVGTVTMQIENALTQISWASNGIIMKAQYVPTGFSTQTQVNNVSAALLAPVINGGYITIGLSKHTIAEQINYTTPDVSSCDSSPGGPHYTTGSYT